MHIPIHLCIHIYTYIYIERDREKEIYIFVRASPPAADHYELLITNGYESSMLSQDVDI